MAARRDAHEVYLQREPSRPQAARGQSTIGSPASVPVAAPEGKSGDSAAAMPSLDLDAASEMSTITESLGSAPNRAFTSYQATGGAPRGMNHVAKYMRTRAHVRGVCVP